MVVCESKSGKKDDLGIIWASIGGKTILHEPTYTI